MHIRQFTAYHVRLPLRRPFSHASQVRYDSENIVVCCQLDNGTIGWGEGVPREYVTGETPVGCLAQLRATELAEQLSAEFNTWPDVIAICEQLQFAVLSDNPRGCVGNALRCAVELSILDAFASSVGEPISKLVEHFAPAQPIRSSRDEVRYSTVIGFGKRLRLKSLLMRHYGFQQCKVKVGAPDLDDVQRLKTLRRWLGPRIDIRVDANEAWTVDQACEILNELSAFGISCVEQPCPHDELKSLARLRSRCPVPVMLDESLTSNADAVRAIELGACDLFNIRLSKCGGFLASIRLAAIAQRAGLRYQLGCHPGESGILSAAGRHWAASIGEIAYLEGSYDRHLFKELLTNEDLTFGYGGLAPALSTPGLGVSINDNVLRKVTVQQELFEIN